MTIQGPMTTSRAAASFDEIEITDLPQTDAAAALVDPATERPATDESGWIDCRSAGILIAQASAEGAGVTMSAEGKTTRNAPAIPITLTTTAVDDGATQQLIADVAVWGYVRFLADGTAGEGNTVSLYVLLK
jgi:hypothetical protein